MTEQSFPFGGTAVAEPPAPTLPASYDEELDDKGNRQKLMAVGAVVAVVVVLLAGFMLLKGGGSSDTSAVAPPHGTPSGPTSGTNAGAAAKPVHLPKNFKGHVGRDPFNPLYTAPVAAAPADNGGKNAAGPTGSTGSPTGNVVGVPPVTVPGPTTGTDTPTTGSTGTTDGVPPSSYRPVWVQLVSVHGTKSATFIVAYAKGRHSLTVTYTDIAAPDGARRTVFGNVFGLLSIQDHMATVQFGDGQPFDLGRGPANRQLLG